MKEDENRIKVNLEAKHFDILPKRDPADLQAEARPVSYRHNLDFLKKQDAEKENSYFNSSFQKGGARQKEDKKIFNSGEFLKKFEDSGKIALNENIKSAGGGIGRIFEKAIVWLAYLLVFFLPLFVLPFSMEIYEFNKTILLFIFSSLAFLFWIIKMVLIDRKIVFVRTPLNAPIIVFISLILISTAFSVDKISSVLGFYGRFSDSLLVYLSLAMFYFVVVNSAMRSVIARSPAGRRGNPDINGGNHNSGHSDINNGIASSLNYPSDNFASRNDSKFIGNILKTFLASAFLVVVAGLFYSFGFEFIPWEEAQFRSFNLAAGSANILGIYLVAVILIALGYRNQNTNRQALSAENKGAPLFKNSMSALIIMSIILLAIIDFAAAWIVLAVSLFMASVLIFVIRRQSQKFGSISSASETYLFPISIIAISLVFIAGSLSFMNKGDRGDSENIFSSSIISASIKNRILSSGGRTEQDKFTKEVILDKKTAVAAAIESVKSDPVAGAIGSGPGTYLYNFSKFKPPEFNNSAFWNVRFDKAGSEILEKISTIGILGTLSYLAIIFLMIAMFLKMLLKIPPTYFDKKGSVYLFAAWFALLLFQFLYLSGTATTFIFWLFTAILAGEYIMAKRLHSPEAGTMEPAENDDNSNVIASQSNYFVLDLKKEKSAFYSSLLAAAVLLISFSVSYYYQIRFYQAEAAYKDISVKQNKSFEGVSLDNQKIGEILDQKAKDMKSKVIEKNPCRGEYKAYLSDIYLNTASLAFQEEGGKSEDEKNTQKIALDMKNAIDYLKDAADSNPNNIIFQHKMGSTYLIAARDLGVAGAGDWAVWKFNRAIELEPTNPVLYTELGKAFNLADQTDLAINEFQKALERKADYIDAGLQLGLSYEKKEEKEKAIDILFSLGSVERIQNAIAAGQIVVSQNLDIDIAFQLGRIYYNTGEVFSAKDVFTKIVKINPNHSNAHYSLGLIYSSEGDKEKALEEFEAVLLLNPENEDVKGKIDELKGVSGDKKSEETAKTKIEMKAETAPIIEEENIESEITTE